LCKNLVAIFWLRLRPAASGCIDNAKALPASPSLQDLSSPTNMTTLFSHNALKLSGPRAAACPAAIGRSRRQAAGLNDVAGSALGK